jgi:hypothetical protein
MSNNGKRNRRPEHYNASKLADAQPGDEAIGDWPRDRLIRMNERFVERMKRAIALGLERPDLEGSERAA